MQRSDNFPLCATIETMCSGESGSFFVFTGFPVKSAMLTSIRIPDGAELVVDMEFTHVDGFRVFFSNMPDGDTAVKFTYQAL